MIYLRGYIAISIILSLTECISPTQTSAGITRVVHATFDIPWKDSYTYANGYHEFEQAILQPGVCYLHIWSPVKFVLINQFLKNILKGIKV